MSTDVRSCKSPNASWFGPDRHTLFALLLEIHKRLEFFRDQNALLLARAVVAPNSSPDFVAYCGDLFRNSEMELASVSARMSSLVDSDSNS